MKLPLSGWIGLIGAIVLIGLILITAPARAHSWYGWECCHDKDCAPLSSPPKAVKGGYNVRGLFFPNGVLKESRDNRWHACILNGKPQCLYAPMGM